ncbi:MAG: hypothetical protein AAFU03_05145 [Bacteroidota bacterium]
MAKKLKLAFAMGGGVSLGTFSGAALTECVKQLVIGGRIVGQNGKEDKYEEVVLDVFSGASAGAISLAIMVRMLIAYRDKVYLLAELPQYKKVVAGSLPNYSVKTGTPTEHRAAGGVVETYIKGLIQEKYKELSDHKKGQLVAIQVAQDFEELLWCHRVNLNVLGGDVAPKVDMSKTGSLLDQGYLEDLAQEAIIPAAGGIVPEDYNQFPVLGDRAFLVNSLTRLQAQEIDGSVAEDVKANTMFRGKAAKVYTALMDVVASQGIKSATHKDLRVFDLNYCSELGNVEFGTSFPKRWVYADKELDLEQKVKSVSLKSGGQKRVFGLGSTELWQDISDTSRAAGAFPLAFEPVCLKRYGFELEEPVDHEYDYIDGGTFNNEPIREAFRLSGFLDEMDTNSPDTYDRLIVYVDPFLASEEHGYKANSQGPSQFGVQKFTATISPLLSVLRTEGSIVEIDKAIGIFNKFRGREYLMDFYSKTIDNGLKDIIADPDAQRSLFDELIQVRANLTEQIRDLQKKVMIPAGLMTFGGEIRKVILNRANQSYFQYSELPELLRNKETVPIALEDYKRFFAASTPEELFQSQYFKAWLKAMFFVAINSIMDLSGKDESNTILPIGPVKIEGGKVKPIKLAGMPLEGFFGFTNKKFRLHDFKTGKAVATNVLAALELIMSPEVPEITTLPRYEWSVVEGTETISSVVKKRLQDDKIVEQIIDPDDGEANWIQRPFINALLIPWLINKKMGIKEMVQKIWDDWE